jgi:hypothetical protein
MGATTEAECDGPEEMGYEGHEEHGGRRRAVLFPVVSVPHRRAGHRVRCLAVIDCLRLAATNPAHLSPHSASHRSPRPPATSSLSPRPSCRPHGASQHRWSVRRRQEERGRRPQRQARYQAPSPYIESRTPYVPFCAPSSMPLTSI